jgi:hypothetical protein
MQSELTLEQCLVNEVRALREEVESLPPGELRGAVEDVSRHAEKLLAQLRDDGFIQLPAFFRYRIFV